MSALQLSYDQTSLIAKYHVKQSCAPSFLLMKKNHFLLVLPKKHTRIMTIAEAVPMLTQLIVWQVTWTGCIHLLSSTGVKWVFKISKIMFLSSYLL